MSQPKTKRTIRRLPVILLVIGLFLVILIGILMTPWNISTIVSRPQPVSTYAQAMERIDAMQATEREYNPVCRTQLLTHDEKVARAVILVHGYTECPQQFLPLGQRFYALGDNVLIVPLPHHGLADRLTDIQAQLTAEELAAYADQVVDIGHGLGEQVTMMGISAGGVTTAWAAQTRSDIDLAMVISPAFGFKQVPTRFTAAAMNLYTLLPNKFVWWVPELQEKMLPEFQYPRYSTRALAQTLRLGYAVQAQARRQKPGAQKIVLVTNPNDMSINNSLTMQVVKAWQAHGAAVDIYEFDAGLGLPHDIIDLDPPNPQTTDLVYTKLIELSNK